MQAGMTGYHPLRIFNPIIQAEKYDDYADFIKKWIPELSQVPKEIVHKPWELTIMEQNFYQCEIGRDYPKPIVNYHEATQKAKDLYWKWRQRADVKNRLPEIWERFSLPEDISNYYGEFFSNQKKTVITESKMYTKYPGS
jgi:deoxyribodipyrimidine photo-lyase